LKLALFLNKTENLRKIQFKTALKFFKPKFLRSLKRNANSSIDLMPYEKNPVIGC